MTDKEVIVLWKKVSTIIADEISSNSEFAQKIGNALYCNGTLDKPKQKNRRNPAKIDPFSFFEQGESILLEELAKLSIDELKDVIAANGMDTSKLAMKWKDRSRLEKHIIEATKRKSARGDAFWNSQGKPENGSNI